MNVKKWSLIIFGIFLLLFLMLALFKNDVTTWIWQLALPVLVVAQVVVILKAKNESKKKFDEDEWYDQK